MMNREPPLKRFLQLTAILAFSFCCSTTTHSQSNTADMQAFPGFNTPGRSQMNPHAQGAVRRIKTADLAVTDIYPGRRPHGQFWLRITNNGPDALKNAVGKVSCFYVSKDKNNGKVAQSPHKNFNVPLNLNPGQTSKFATGLAFDMNVFKYFVQCEVRPKGFNDMNPPNDMYHEDIQ